MPALTPAGVLALQRSAGNGAVNRILQREKAEAADTESIVEDYPVRPGAEDSLERHVWKRDTSVGDVASHTYYDEGVRRLSKDGLREYLASRQNGRVSAFDKRLASTWGEDEHVQLTLALKVGGTGIFAYMLDTGSTGDRVRTVYASDGTVVAERHSETPLVNMGLGPFEWLILAGAALGAAKWAWRAAASRLGAEEAAAAVADTRVVLGDNDLVLAVIEDETIVARTVVTGKSHLDLLTEETNWTIQTLPANVQVVTIGKLNGRVVAMRSPNIHGNGLPASDAAQAAAQAAYR